MKISEVINKIKNYHQGVWNGKLIDDETTRDQVLYGNTSKECLGVITTCWASVDVIKKAAKMGANLIIAHEAMFWNHGDETDWLESSNNETFKKKKELLKKYNIVVWRDHDHIHSGIPLKENVYVDGIFYGFAKELGWENYIVPDNGSLVSFDLPKSVSTLDISKMMIDKLNLDGARILGDPNTMVKRIDLPSHIWGDAKPLIVKADKEKFDLFITMEQIDFTLSEYIRDSSQLGLNKSIISIGHFNVEEAGMKYMTNYLPNVIGKELCLGFIQSGDMYHYIK